MDLSCFLVLPVSSQLKWKVKLDCPGSGTIVRTATAIPAFFRMQDNRWFAFLRMRDIYIDLTCFYTDVTPVTDFRIEYHRVIRRRNIGNRKHFFLRHVFLQKFIYKVGSAIHRTLSFRLMNTRVVFIVGFILLLHAAPKFLGLFPDFYFVVFQLDCQELVPFRRIHCREINSLEI